MNNRKNKIKITDSNDLTELATALRVPREDLVASIRLLGLPASMVAVDLETAKWLVTRFGESWVVA